MVRELYDKIKAGKDVRKNLIALKAELKETSNQQALCYYMAGDYDILLTLLGHEDAKIRKNVALILGKVGKKEFLLPLFTAYQKEETLFVRSAYLNAIKELDYREIIADLKKAKEQLEAEIIREEEKKHKAEELKVLTELILAIDGRKKHLFTGYETTSKIILLTNRNYKNITLEQLEEETTKTFQAGIIVQTDRIKKVLSIRTYQEALFLLGNRTSVNQQPKKAANELIESGIVSFLEERHKEKAPFYFRIEVKGKMGLKEKSIFAKKLAMELEEKTNRKLINTSSYYEVEFRLVENKEGRYHFFIKLYTIPDTRFSYRQEMTATSMRPANAALAVALAKPYLKEKADVLDPFCGVGTLLIERHKLKEAKSLYGIDVFGQAIEMARKNTEIANMIVHYINRDFFQFQHAYEFDEIITDMPTAKGSQSSLEIQHIYERFFIKAKEHLKIGGIMVLYSHNKRWIEQYASKDDFSILERFELSRIEELYLYILKKK